MKRVAQFSVNVNSRVASRGLVAHAPAKSRAYKHVMFAQRLRGGRIEDLRPRMLQGMTGGPEESIPATLRTGPRPGDQRTDVTGQRPALEHMVHQMNDVGGVHGPIAVGIPESNAWPWRQPPLIDIVD